MLIVTDPHSATGFFDFIESPSTKDKSNPELFRLLSQSSGFDSSLLPCEFSLSRDTTSSSSFNHVLEQRSDVMHDHPTVFTLFLLLDTVAYMYSYPYTFGVSHAAWRKTQLIACAEAEETTPHLAMQHNTPTIAGLTLCFL